MILVYLFLVYLFLDAVFGWRQYQPLSDPAVME